MDIDLGPEFRDFIEEQVRNGRYPSAHAVIEDALALLMYDLSDEQIDDETFAALEESEEQIRRGDVMTLEAFRLYIRRRNGPWVEMDKADFRRMRERLDARLDARLDRGEDQQR